MINRELLIGKVSPFLNKRVILVDNQDTIDIIDALIKNHYKYSKEYDKIFRYFDGGSVEETAYNVWQFLKDNFKYTIEPEKMQILRSPAALLASNIVGIDCKGYATFANGIMDAYRKNSGKNFDIYYRFASYDAFDSTPQHVFSVVKENNIEYWIDPVLDQFDEKKQPYYYKDKKIKNMALVAMSGIPHQNRNNYIGDIFSDLAKTGASGASALATGGANISADIALIQNSLQFVGNLWNQFTAHPAADARDFIANLKPQIVNVNPHTRLSYIISGDSKINDKAKDVSASELVLWYKRNYPNDYKNLTNADKIYWNNYLQEQAVKYKGVNQAARDYTNAMFTSSELSYNATPIENVTNTVDTAAKSLTTSNTNWVLYGALAIGAILLIKKMK